MNVDQAINTLSWVEAMLSGDYKFGRGMLYNLSSGCHCALAVGAEILGQPRNQYTGEYFGGSRATVPEGWFEESFGLPKTSEYYAGISDKSQNYFGVCAMLLKEVPNNISWRLQLEQELLKAVQHELMHENLLTPQR